MCDDHMIYHSGYLKLYQLTCPEITGYDCILVDEAQDLTPGWFHHIEPDSIHTCSCSKYKVSVTCLLIFLI